MTNKATHWTERSAEDYVYSIASDFIEKLQEKMDALPMNQSELAKAAKVSKGYVSRVFKNPGNLRLASLVKFARAVGLHVSILGYATASDPDNNRGPISPDVFIKTWEDAGSPSDMWAFAPKSEAPSLFTVSQLQKWNGLPYGLNRGMGNRAVDVLHSGSAVTIGVSSNIPEYKVQETIQPSDTEVFINA